MAERTKRVQLLRNQTVTTGTTLDHILEKWGVKVPEASSRNTALLDTLLDGEQIIGRYSNGKDTFNLGEVHTIYGIAHIWYDGGVKNIDKSYIEVFYDFESLKTKLSSLYTSDITAKTNGVFNKVAINNGKLDPANSQTTLFYVNGQQLTVSNRELGSNGDVALETTLTGENLTVNKLTTELDSTTITKDDTLSLAISKLNKQISSGVVSSVSGATSGFAKITITPDGGKGDVTVTPELTEGTFSNAEGTGMVDGLATVNNIETTYKLRSTSITDDNTFGASTEVLPVVVSASYNETSKILSLEEGGIEPGSNISFSKGKEDSKVAINATDTKYSAGNGITLTTAGSENQFSIKLKETPAESPKANEINILSLDGQTEGLKELFANAFIEKTGAAGTNLATYKLMSGSHQLGAEIVVPKDQTLRAVYVGHVDDILDPNSHEENVPDGIKSGSGVSSLNFIHILNDGNENLTKIPVSDFATEALYGDGLIVENSVVKADLTDKGGLAFDNGGTGNGTIKVQTKSGNPVQVDEQGNLIYKLANAEQNADNGNYISGISQDNDGKVTILQTELPKATVTSVEGGKGIEVTKDTSNATKHTVNVALADDSLEFDAQQQNKLKVKLADNSLRTDATAGVSVGIVDCGYY